METDPWGHGPSWPIRGGRSVGAYPWELILDPRGALTSALVNSGVYCTVGSIVGSGVVLVKWAERKRQSESGPIQGG